jgi:Ca2+-binding EF-hand superfamily protein
MRRMTLSILLITSPCLAWPGSALADKNEPLPPRPAMPDLRPLAKSLRQSLASLKHLEFVEVISAVARGSKLGPGEGWFHPAQTRYDWKWLAGRFDANKDGKIERREFPGQDDVFNRLDRDRDGVLTRADFDWSENSPLARQTAVVRHVFRFLDANSNGRVSREEWEAFFSRVSSGKEYITPDDLLDALRPPQPSKKNGPPPKGPTPAVFLKGLLTGELGSPFEGPRLGQVAPDFTLDSHDGKRRITLSKFRGKKPVVLVFGSFT